MRPLQRVLLHERIHEVAKSQGASLAIIASNVRMSYQNLVRKANQLGYFLRSQGARPNQLVAIVMEKGWEQVVACLGILNAGSAYLPIDPLFPPSKLEELFTIGEICFVLTQRRFINPLTRIPYIQKLQKGHLIAIDDEPAPFSHCPSDRLESVQKPEDLAYVIFTSGSTGTPKGVMIEHRAALNTILDVNERYNVSSDDKVLALSNLNFDLSVYDIFGVLTAGGAIVFPEPDNVKNPFHWMDLLLQEKITIWNTVPMFMQILVEVLDQPLCCNLRLILLSGDWIPIDLPNQIRNRLPLSLRLISLGGATEASIWSISYEIAPGETFTKSIPYGRSMRNQAVYVLNDQMEMCPKGIIGELYIGGIGVSRGYWRDAAKTEQNFLLDPHWGRLYKTGDFGQYLSNNLIEFLGRKDFQVKINGYRIELQEIEYQLHQYPGVVKAIVATRKTSSQNPQLVAYIVPAEEASHHPQDPIRKLSSAKLDDFQAKLVGHLSQYLPQYMVPSVFIMMNRVPLSSNGKVDRQALAEV